jgi:hypothetical protein
MNQNIEVINDNLLAVHFRFIPFISEIDYHHDPKYPMFEESGCITTDGRVLLNKDHQRFTLYLSVYPGIMQKSEKRINKELASAAKIINKTDEQIIYTSMLKWELARRCKKRRWKKHGNS